MLLGVIVAASAATGWAFGRAQPSDELLLVEASFHPDTGGGDAATAASEAVLVPDADEVGRLRAEMLRLRVLFQRLADVAELDDDGEFDLDFDIDGRTGAGEPLSALDPASPDTLPLLIERFAPMVYQSERMARIFAERRQDFDRRLSGRPLADGRLSSGFGHRVDPITGARVMHRGLDFTGSVGDPVLAIADGVVTWSGPNGGYGLLVELEHAGGFRTRYAHNDENLATLGARVRKGEQIATLGSSGRSTGPHLHLEIRKEGTALDPRYFVR